MARRRPLSGWQIQQQRQFVEVFVAPTRWDQFLSARSLTDAKVLRILRRGKGGREVVEWIHRNKDSAFIPENILRQIGCYTRYD